MLFTRFLTQFIIYLSLYIFTFLSIYLIIYLFICIYIFKESENDEIVLPESLDVIPVQATTNPKPQENFESQQISRINQTNENSRGLIG